MLPRAARRIKSIRSSDGEGQGMGVGIADVFAGKDHHPPQDEPRVLPRLKHAEAVQQGRIGIGAAQALDERGNCVVMMLTRPIIRRRRAPFK